MVFGSLFLEQYKETGFILLCEQNNFGVKLANTFVCCNLTFSSQQLKSICFVCVMYLVFGKSYWSVSFFKFPGSYCFI